jgi:hypothetical protein
VASIAKRPDGAYRPWYRDGNDEEHARHFKRQVDAQRWLDEVTAAMVTGNHADTLAGKIKQPATTHAEGRPRILLASQVDLSLRAGVGTIGPLPSSHAGSATRAGCH